MSAEQTAMNNPATKVERQPGLFGLIAEDLDCVFQRDPEMQRDVQDGLRLAVLPVRQRAEFKLDRAVLRQEGEPDELRVDQHRSVIG